ncbi:uncharacterized mitochondrial protein AtMg00810-like [Vicia villosa]|uniref:uncharacterized mitochondrial protein AtMg00810-like n=1 Tax=Vicia villosa TaxID=3911 RepID=UPI00273AF052|nr:uncharacterized mitochondrial protein AtMg00810-like [Vicia villosa]
MLIYVDDIILTGSSPIMIQQLITKLDSVFSLKQLGDLDYFLGIEVKRTFNGNLLLSQGKYVRDLLQRAEMDGCKSITTPLPAAVKLSKAGTDFFEDPALYRSIVGALQYVTITRPELGYSVNKVCQFMSQPLVSHWSAVKRILRYLKGTSDYGLVFKPASSAAPIHLRAYCDADWASDMDDRRSTSGACVFLGPNLISWWSKKQTLVAKSSAEAEYRSLALAASEILWVQSLLHELCLPIPTPVIYCDNQSTVALSHNPVLHSRTKHMELDIFFVREKVLYASKSKNFLVGTALPSLERGQPLLITTSGGVTLAPMRINYVRVKVADVIRNVKIVVHSVYLPFPHINPVAAAYDSKLKLSDQLYQMLQVWCRMEPVLLLMGVEIKDSWCEFGASPQGFIVPLSLKLFTNFILTIKIWTRQTFQIIF